jgi:CheY-like chemotaxis protein
MSNNNFDIEKVDSWTILVVDDDEDNRLIAVDTFETYGATVHTADNGDSGLKLLDSLALSFILLDLSMPVMDGWNMLKQLRSTEKTASIPVIALTAHAMTGDQERAMAAGFDGYITKPFDIITVVGDIKKVLKQVMATRAKEGAVQDDAGGK